ncbi:hypothetical protein UlMin_017025 [Ulmus minor]
MKKSGVRNVIGGMEEENILALIDSSETKDTQDANDDRLAFLEAVRATTIVSENGTPATQRMFEQVFKILRVGHSLELIMASYQLLNELDKYFPRICLPNVDKSQSESNPVPELVVVNEAWSPFKFASNQRGADENNGGPLDSSGFHLLIQDLLDLASETNFLTSHIKSLRDMLLFQYLVNVLESDFLCRNSAYEGTMNWTLVRESFLNILLGSRKINFKSLMKDCLNTMCNLYQISEAFSDDLIHQEKSVVESAENTDSSVVIALFEVGKNTCISMQKLLSMIMELDTSKQKADMQRSITRADGVRTPLLELILDELTYNRDIIHPFLQVFDEPKWKLELVVQYFWKYISKPAVRTRRSNGSPDDTSFNGALKCFSNITSTRSAIKKIGAKVIQLLLVHGFKAFLSLPSQQHPDEGISASGEERMSCSLTEICENMISCFTSLRKTNELMEISPLGKEALFTAATILSIKS